MTENADLQIDGTPMRPVFNESSRAVRLDLDASSLEARGGLQECRTKDGTRVHVELDSFAVSYLAEARRRGVAVGPAKWTQVRHEDGWWKVIVYAFAPTQDLPDTRGSLTPTKRRTDLAKVDALCDQLGIKR